MVDFIQFNANPWKKDIDDCAIRAVSLATGMKYVEVCKRLKVQFHAGYGLVQSGIDLERIKVAFNRYFTSIVDVLEDNAFIPDDASSKDLQTIQKYDDSASMTISEFGDIYDGTGSFVINANGNPKSRIPYARDVSAQHIVYLRCSPGRRPCIYDTFDSRDLLVNCYMQVERKVPKDSSLHWIYDKTTKRMLP